METTAPGLFLVTMDVPAEIEARFNYLYDSEHLAEVLAVPGVIAGRRYQAVEGAPKFQAVYDLKDVAVVTSAAFHEMVERPGEWSRQIRPHFFNYDRRVFTQIYPDELSTPPAPARGGGVLLVGLAVPPERDEEFNAWYNTEHLPCLTAVPGVLRARRFRSVDDSPQYLAVYELADPEVPRTEAFQKAARSPWTARQRTWFQVWLRVRSRAVATLNS